MAYILLVGVSTWFVRTISANFSSGIPYTFIHPQARTGSIRIVAKVILVFSSIDFAYMMIGKPYESAIAEQMSCLLLKMEITFGEKSFISLVIGTLNMVRLL